ncbi:MAG: hypothetical protein JNK82_15500 [Myxococcaceae bacterium]|nr:hypothetical protein [Myxococcaceae bacterium]
MRRVVCAAVLALAGCSTVKLSVAGEAAVDARVFVQPPRYAGQEDGNTVSLVAAPTGILDVADGTHVFRLTPFYRLDPRDERRSHFDLREASYRLQYQQLQVLAGFSTVTWGTLEMHRPSDVINQHDLVESLSENAKLGQPMVSVGWVGESASLKAYWLPYFREKTFPGVRGRLRSPATIDQDHPQYETQLGPWQPSGALRFTLNRGDFDFGLSAFTGLSREPRFVLELTEGQLAPRYDTMHQASADVQWTQGALTLKAEAFVRLWSQKLVAFTGGGAGLEYTFFQLAGDADLSFALEGYWDTRPVDAPPTFFDHDLFAGLRFALNDTGNLEVVGGVLFDVLSRATLARIEVSRRFGDHWRAYVSAHVFGFGHGTLQGSFVDDSHLAARVAYFF